MTEYSKIARGSFTTGATPTSQVIRLPFQPQRVELVNVTSSATPAQDLTTKAFWDVSMPQGTATMEYISAAATPWNTAVDAVAAGGVSTFSAGLALQYGPKIQIISATAATPPVFTVAANPYAVGDVVVLEGLYQSPTTGMAQMSGMQFVVSAVTPTTFTVFWNAGLSNYTALSGSPVGAFVKKVLYPFLYAPGVSNIARIQLGTTTLIKTTARHNLSVGSEVAFRIPQQWGTVELNSLPNASLPGSPKYGYVVSVPSSTTFVVDIDSSAYTAFNPNQTIASVPGLTPPQVLAVGDVNTGGQEISPGSPLYPSPIVDGAPTINGPAIKGAFVNNTSSGFAIGLGVGVDSGDAILDPSSLYVWTAYYYDMSL